MTDDLKEAVERLATAARRVTGVFASGDAGGGFDRTAATRRLQEALAEYDRLSALKAAERPQPVPGREEIASSVGSPPEGGTPSPSDGQVLRAGKPPLGVGPGYRFAGSDAELAAILLEGERDLHAYGDGEPGATYDCALPAYIGEAAARLLKPKHVYWGAGEPDCPREIKAGNGELHTLRCKRCGQDDPRDPICRYGSARP